MQKNDKVPVQRSNSQNRAIHKYLDMVAHELQNQGQTLSNVVAKIPVLEITPTTHALKEVLWKPVQEAILGKKSTKELTTAEVNKVYEMVSVFLANQFEISLPFPSYEDSPNYLQSLEQ